ncbi:substrate-binding domain-containing protein [Nocardioides sp.]|jgi:ABC-type phosphate transport system substrate-binding protein|uniref:substrate-binding domain-containing protein n=1 Tax=Nocardioides sp. TaxID=35761 RepID=UPI0026099D60|nr:substrate-binding domain-containing protein [Nocardioides sp.]
MRTHTHARRTLVAALTLATGLTLAACGSDDGDSAGDNQDSGVSSINESDREAGDASATNDGDEPVTTEDGTVLVGTLPDPEPGLIRIDGAEGTLTPRANSAYLAESGNRINQTFTGESRAFQRLCVGEIDLVDSARPISPAEWEQCQAQGLDIVQFQVAADALVLAIKNETDVGGDCLNTNQVNEIFRVGSTVNNWSQLGTNFDDVPLRTGGPDIDTGELRFFGRYILNSPEPSLSNFAGSYRVFQDEDDTRIFVVGSATDQLRTKFLPKVEPRRERFRLQLQQALRVLADTRAEVKVAVAEQKKGIRDERTPAARAADDERVRVAYAARGEAVTEVNRIRAIYTPLNKRYLTLKAAQARVDATNGRLGIFRQSYYAVYENLLRPFEIEVADGDGQMNCIFPSPQTIVNGQYPLSRQLLITTTTRALKRPETSDYLKFYLQNSRTFADNEQAISLPGKDIQTQVAWIDTKDYPNFASVDGGPVEVQEGSMAGDPETAPPPVENPAR